jgi:hypothetical protein
VRIAALAAGVDPDGDLGLDGFRQEFLGALACLGSA